MRVESIGDHVLYMAERLRPRSDLARLAFAAAAAERAFAALADAQVADTDKQLLRETLDAVWSRLERGDAAGQRPDPYDAIVALVGDEDGDERSPIFTDVASAIAYLARADDSHRIVRDTLQCVFSILDFVLLRDGEVAMGGTAKERQREDRRELRSRTVQREIGREEKDLLTVTLADREGRWDQAVRSLRAMARAEALLG